MDEKINKLIDYYLDDGLLILGLNDSQGVNTTSAFFKKGMLEYLASLLTNDTLKPLVINAFSLTINKTEHIDYFLKNNLSLEEIKLSQIYSVISALEKIIDDLGLPQILSRVGNISRIVYNIKKGDSDIKISSSLKEAKEPLVVYSSGVNNLMREIGSNPLRIKKDYKTREKKPNFYYTLEKVKNEETLKKVIDSIENNFNNLLSLNDDSDIFALGAYVPKSLKNEEMNVFRDLILLYNLKLIELCKEYGVSFVDVNDIGEKYNNSEANFHISCEGHKELAKKILEGLYFKKFESPSLKKCSVNQNFVITNQGADGVIEATMRDFARSYGKAMHLNGYSQRREVAISKEHEREIDIFKKVLAKTKK